MSSSEVKFYFIGLNLYGSFGLGQGLIKHPVLEELTECPNKLITKTFRGFAYNIFADNNFDNIFAAGYNYEEKCALSQDEKSCIKITHFERNGIKINKIFTNINGHITFFLSDKNKLYAYVKR